MKTIKGGISAPKGFSAAGISAGLKKSGKNDMALIFSEVPASSSGMFTSNKVKAAPVILSQKLVKGGVSQAVIVNSGCANACTGKAGIKHAELMVRETAKALKIKAKHVLVASTGSIGSLLPVKKISKGIKRLPSKLSSIGGASAARAIMTTDTRPKEIAVAVRIKGKEIRIGGMAKGAGMINPHLTPHATMLAFITTDAKIKPSLLSKTVAQAVRASFNMTTVDRDRSTNDTLFALANGMSGAPEIREGTGDHRIFSGALGQVCVHLAKEIARDGEGATKLIEIRVRGAKTSIEARRAAKFIAGSELLKAAVFGADPNWGRVMAALGSSGAQMKPDKVDVSIGKVRVVRGGKGVKFSHGAARRHMKGKEVVYTVDLNLGKHEAAAWGCDLGYGYVRINAEYHT